MKRRYLHSSMCVTAGCLTSVLDFKFAPSSCVWASQTIHCDILNALKSFFVWR